MSKCSQLFAPVLTLALFLSCLLVIGHANRSLLAQPKDEVLESTCTETDNLVARAALTFSGGVFNVTALSDGVGSLEGEGWDSRVAALFELPEGSVVWKLPRVVTRASLALQADSNDSYTLESSIDGVSWSHLWSAEPVVGHGLRTRRTELDGKPFLHLRLTASGGDGLYSISEIVLSCAEKGAVFTTQITQSHFPAVEQREGIGAILWVAPWGVLFMVVLLLSVARILIRKSDSYSSKAKTLAHAFISKYMAYDVSSLALFRIVLGALLIYDLLQRWGIFHLFYAVDGIARLEDVLPSELGSYTPFTIFRYLASDVERQLFFLLSAIAYLCFLFGIFTKTSHLAAFLCAVSLHNANPIIGHSGHMVIRLSLIWSFFLPLGAVYSIDALLKRGQGRANDDGVGHSWAYCVVMMQLASIYFFNTISKFAEPWVDGSIVFAKLHDEAFSTSLGLLARDHLPLELHRILAWGTLLIEGVAPFLLLSPWKPSLFRTIAFVGLTLMHIGVMLLMPLSIFSWAMVALLCLILPGKVTETILKRRPKNTISAGLSECGAGDAGNRSRGLILVNILVATYLILAHLSQLVRENEPLASWFPHRPIPALQVSLETFRTFQGWCMFASCSNTSYGVQSATLVVTAKDPVLGKVDLLRSLFLGKALAAPHSYREQPHHITHELWHSYQANLLSGHPALVAGLNRWINSRHLKPAGLSVAPVIEVYERWQPLSLYLLSFREPFITKKIPKWVDQLCMEGR